MQTPLRILVPAVLLAASASGQNPFYGPAPLGQIRQYLQLSDSQVEKILRNNDDYNRWSYGKQARISQVQSEIYDETRKEPLDPAALGIRYAEIEAICRDMKDRAKTYRSQNVDVLDSAQKVKLNALEEALKLAPIISEGQYGNLGRSDR